MRDLDLVSVGTIYVDVSCLHFPFEDSLLANKEVVGDTYDIIPGGSAFNFSRICKELGLRSGFVGKRGKDSLGKLLTSLVKKTGVELHVSTDEAAQTNIAIHYVKEDGVSIMTSCGSANQKLTYNSVIEKLEPLFPRMKYLYLGGCFKIKTLLPEYKKIAKLAHTYGVKVVLDHGRVNNSVSNADIEAVKELCEYVDYYLPSKDEFISVWNKKSIMEAIKQVRKISDALIVVKDSENGVVVSETKKKVVKIPAFEVVVKNTVGAGDSFNAGFISALVMGKNIQDSATFANAVAAIKISTLGKIEMNKVNNLIDPKQKTRKIAILGASGFIGSVLSKKLLQQNTIALDSLSLCTRNKSNLDSAPLKNKKVSVFSCDHTILVQVQELTQKHDVIISLAGLAWQHPGGNAISAKELLVKQLIQNGISALFLGKSLQENQKLIWTSTSAIDGMFARLSKKNTELLLKEVTAIADILLQISSEKLKKRKSVETYITDFVNKYAFLEFPFEPGSKNKGIYAQQFSYAYSKLIGQIILEKLSKNNITVLKISDVYGLGQDISKKALKLEVPARRLQRFIAAYREIARGNTDWISKDESTFGFTKKGDQISQNVWNDWAFPTHVDDVCEMIILAIKNKPVKTVLNVNGNRISNEKLVKELVKYFGLSITINLDKKPTYEMTQDSTDLELLGMSKKNLKSFTDGVSEWIQADELLKAYKKNNLI